MTSFARLILGSFLLIGLTLPQITFAVDETGGRCFCTIKITDSTAGFDEPPIITESHEELGEDYSTTDQLTCQSACETYADVETRSLYLIELLPDGADYKYQAESEAASAARQEAEEKASEYLRPNLNVDIPGLTFSDILNENGVLKINFLPEYLNGLYRYALGAAAILAVIMIMIGGVQYILGSGLGSIEAGKKRITNAVTGLVLVLAAYTMLYLVDPNLTTFTAVEVNLVAQINADLDTAGPEGSTGGARARSCDEAIADAQSSDSCPISQRLFSPTSTDPIGTSTVKCGYHFTEKNVGYDYQKMTSGLDFIGDWGDPLYAPGDGTVKFVVGTEENANAGSRCGNNIVITLTGGGTFTICHVKAFEPAAVSQNTVKRGDLIGYIGGNCCVGESRPSTWDVASVTGTCNTGGVKCGDPFGGNTECGCQAVYASGNTTGAHAHGSLFGPGGARLSLLACLSGESSTEEAGESESSECVEGMDAEGNAICEDEEE